MSLSYKELYSTLKDLKDEQTNDPTHFSEYLVDCMDNIDTALVEYRSSNTDDEREEALSNANFWLERFYNIEKLENPTTTSNSTFQEFETVEDADYLSMPNEAHTMLDRVHEYSNLRLHSNTVHAIFEATIGVWFENNNVVENIKNKTTVKNAEGGWLRALAEQYGISNPRNSDGSYKYTDEELRNKIIHRVFQRFTVPELRSNDYDDDGTDEEVVFFTFTPNPFTELTSKNTYLAHRYFGYCTDSETEDYYYNKYITEDGCDDEDVYYEKDGVVTKPPLDTENPLYMEKDSGYKVIKGEIIWL